MEQALKYLCAAAGENCVRTLIRAAGDDPNREGLKDTPARVLKAYQEMFAGYKMDPKAILDKTFAGPFDEMVVVKDIEFTSTCEHHMLPFYGVAHVGYLPRAGRVFGLSKLARLVECFALRLQVQENICAQVADALNEAPLTVGELGRVASGAGCVIEATHFCMACRGVRKPGAKTVTSALRGLFKSDPTVRSEFLSLTRS